MSVRMPLKDYLYLKNELDLLDRYVINVAYSAPDQVDLDFLDHKKKNFRIEYKSLIQRVGVNGEESYNNTGVRLKNIWENYISDQLDN